MAILGRIAAARAGLEDPEAATRLDRLALELTQESPAPAGA